VKGMKAVNKNTDYVDYNMLDVLQIPNDSSLFIHEEDKDKNMLIKFSYTLSQNMREELILKCKGTLDDPNGGGYTKDEVSITIDKSAFEEMIIDCIEERILLHEQENFEKLIDEVREDLTNTSNRLFDANFNRGKMNVKDKYREYNIDKEFSFEGEGVLVETGNEDTVVLRFDELVFEGSLEDGISSPTVVTKGKLKDAVFSSGLEDEPLISDCKLSFIDYNDKTKIDIVGARVDDYGREESYVTFNTNEHPILKSLTSGDLREMQIKKLQAKRSSDTVTANRIMSIKINEEVNKNVKKEKKEKRKNEGVKNRFNKILGN
jgi:hypothetical protein